MARRRTARRPSRRWLWRALIVAVIVVPVLAWLLPRRVHDVVSIDGRHRWEHALAPPQKRIVWQPAEKLPARIARSAAPEFAQASLARPQWADGGLTLYFTLQTDGGADIYRSRFDGVSWSSGIPVAELNSDADDFGPVISADGKQLYLYSNRTGGFGGFDVYVSRKTDDGWSPPKNLGQRINSPAHEYDPAITPDGERLFFSSNRTQRMQRRIAEAGDDLNEKDIWQASLRSEPGLRQFDIYSAERSGASGWAMPEPVAEVNRSITNEGEPYVSPNGAFLYFASDRFNRHGAQANYDIYRARIDGEHIFAVENLGPGVNTAANEHEPALSAEGFRIVFSSDRMADGRSSPDADTYALYVSQASEIYDVAGWDTSHLSLITDNLWFIVLLLLIAGLIAALIWYLRQVSLRRAPIPAFFLIALLLHLIMATGAFFVPIDGVTIVARIKGEMDKIVATNLELESPTTRPRENAFEKVADVEAASAADVTPAPREQTQPQQVALSQEFNTPRTPAELTRSRPVAPIVVQPELEQPMTAENPQLSRLRRTLEEVIAANKVELEQMEVTQEEVQNQASQSANVQVNKADSPTQDQVATLTTPQSRSMRPLERESVNVRPTQDPAQPRSAIDAAMAVKRRVRRDVEQFVQPKAVMEQPTTANQSPSDSIADSANVNAVRETDSPNFSPNATQFQANTTSPRTTDLIAQAIDAARPSPSRLPSQPNTPTESSLPRQDRVAKVNFEATDKIPLNNNAPANSANQQGIAATSHDVGVELNRSAAGAPNLTFETPQQTGSAGSQASAVTPDASAAAEAASLPSKASTGLSVIADQFKRKPNRPLEFAMGEAELSGELAAASDSADSKLAAVRGSDVNVNRSSDGTSANVGSIAEFKSSTLASNNTELASAGGAIRRALGAIEGMRGNSRPIEFSRLRRGLPDESANIPASFEEVTSGSSNDAEGELAAAPGVNVNIDRTDESGGPGSLESLLGEIASNSPGRPGTPQIGELARVDLDARFEGDVSGSPLGRKDARPAFLSYAQGKVGLQAMLRLRVTDDETKRDLIEAFGGSPNTLPAVARGLAWLAIVQHEDGSWKLHDFPKGPNGQKFSGHGKSKSDSAATGLALLPFLGDGHTHLGGKYQKQVQRGIDWLLKHQDDDGNLFTGGEGNAHMYSHGIAAIALCEAFGMTEDEQLREPAQRAIDYIVRAQHKEGGWRYRPGDAGDTSVVGWQVMALKSAQMAGLNVPQSTLEKARRYLQSARRGKDKAEYGYVKSGGGTPAMTAEGLLCHQYLGAKQGDPQLLRTVEVVAARPPKHGKDTSYYWYYGTQAMFHVQGEPWKKWNDTMEEAILSRQVNSGPNLGTWDPKDKWEQSGGRIMSTSLRLLMLEVTFRHLPLYRAMD